MILPDCQWWMNLRQNGLKRRGIGARPFSGMSALREELTKALAAHRAVKITPADATPLVRQVTGWQRLPEMSKPRESDEQAKLDAAFNTMTDIASCPWQSPCNRPFSNASPESGCGILTKSLLFLRFRITGHLASLPD